MSSEGKYVIHATIRVDGTVARKDVVGAIFGQTEGLLGEGLQLRKLQSSGRIGHVDVSLNNHKGRVRNSRGLILYRPSQYCSNWSSSRNNR